MKKKNFFKPILLIFYLLIVIGELYILNSMSTYGSNLSSIENEITKVNEENDVLGEVIASASSVTTLYQKASKLGFKTNTSLYSFESLPIALYGSPSN